MNTGLGRGLGSLIPQKIKKIATDSAGEAVLDIISEADKGKVIYLALDKIKVNPHQPRSKFAEQSLGELAESIKQHGIIQPLIVSKFNGEYELIAGERRLRAAKNIGLDKAPVIIRDASSQQKLEMALIENLQRENLNPLETALAFRKLIDEFNLTQEETARRVGKSRSAVANSLRLLNLPDEIQSALAEGRISEGHAKILAGLEGEVKQTSLFKRIIHGDLSVEDTVAETRRMGGTKQARVKINYADKDKEFAFREFFGAKAEIKRKGKGGQVVIDFYSDEELEEMAGKLTIKTI